LIIGSENYLKDIYADHSFLALNKPLKLSIANNILRTELVYKSIIKNDTVRYYPVSPLYKPDTILVGIPPIEEISLVPFTFKFKNRNGSLTGMALQNGYSFEIKPTG